MFRRLVDSIRKSPSKVALAVTVSALVLNLGIATLWFQKTRAANLLAAEITLIRENLAHMEQIEEGEIEELRAQLAGAEEQLASLQRGLADTEVSFDLVAEVFDIAERSGVIILSVGKEDVTTQDTGAGSFTATRFSVQVEGTFTDFMKFVENLEAAAPKSVSLDNMVLTQEGKSGLFEVIVLSGVEVEGP
jgi:Tfp pilus assembly protein PilO